MDRNYDVINFFQNIILRKPRVSSLANYIKIAIKLKQSLKTQRPNTKEYKNWKAEVKGNYVLKCNF